MKYPRHPKYKPSGVEWLGEVPHRWTVERLKNAARYWVSNVDKVPVDDELPVRLCNYTDVYYNERITPGSALMETTATADEIQRFGLLVDDVIITKDSEEWTDIAVPSLVVETAPDLVCGYHLAIIRPDTRRLIGAYLLRVFQSCAVNQQFRVAATGVTRYGLPANSIGEASIPVPPLEEQRAIVDVLDAQTAKLDTLMTKKRELIEKLKEKRTALISRTVIRGLPPDAARAAGLSSHPKLKSSGIAWLGDVPAHWEVMRLRHHLRSIEQGWSPECEARLAEEDEWGVLKVGCVNGDEFNASEHKALPSSLSPSREYEIKPGDILMSRANTAELLGNVVRVRATRPRLLLCDKLYRLSVMNIDAEYLVFLLNSTPVRYQYERDATGTSSSMKNIGQDTVRNLAIPLPRLPEQRFIADYLVRETAKIDQMLVKVEAAIERLEEYRSALITAAVTGKIDVRGDVSAATSTAMKASGRIRA